MKAATVSQLKKELNFRSREELLELCLRLSKFKKENKELLTYLLFEEGDEVAYIQNVKQEVDELFKDINTKAWFYIKKSIRKILRVVKKYIRYSGKKDTEVELLMYFCFKLKNFSPSIKRNPAMQNLYDRQLISINKTLLKLHEDLQYDYKLQMEEMGI
ncbi:hypothetical protein FHG64_07915 [Antarcticibacterium flavum]|uniref:Uncharacterized protein n=1 Tax=Antarcticibacterium flavum TaxID=2058175 RepID=A0A5B7X151_9FLAO|nr:MULTISPECIES: hypothetical protein [Antarcticibacterium]MCM4161438.1 hypothetical protein [Antarcticibacterium sp. W02-3]QCY69324.1 hypothetical protein FHG64_07915 [Antarcticibacterium flavum]